MLNKINKSLASLTTQQLVMIPNFISLIFLGLFIMASITKPDQTEIKLLLLNIVFFLWGSSGIPMIIRKEAPPPWYSRGWLAVIHGIVTIILAWGMILILIFRFFR